jgi:serine/threonine protein kinase
MSPPSTAPSPWRTLCELKHDVFGRVECIEGPTGDTRRRVRRVASGNGWPLTRLVARVLLRRERRALAALAGCPGVPSLVADATRRPGELLRTYLDGEPLWSASRLPRDFFDRLRELVARLHALGVCHNDLHKENNILVGADGVPCLIDFQLASVHRHRGRLFARRCAADLRHVEKHRCRYDSEGREALPRPRGVAPALLRWFYKPIYNCLVRRCCCGHRGEQRRPREGPWPVRTPAPPSPGGRAQMP